MAEALRTLTAYRELGQNLAKDSGLLSLLFPYPKQRWPHLPSSHEAVSTLGLALCQQWLWGDRPMVIPDPHPSPALLSLGQFPWSLRVAALWVFTKQARQTHSSFLLPSVPHQNLDSYSLCPGQGCVSGWFCRVVGELSACPLYCP